MPFPEEIVTFPQLEDIGATDASLVQQYQTAMLSGNLAQAQQILSQIPNGQKKIVTADYFNTIISTLNDLQNYFIKRYSPAYVVSETQPLGQQATDFWFQITG